MSYPINMSQNLISSIICTDDKTIKQTNNARILDGHLRVKNHDVLNITYV